MEVNTLVSGCWLPCRASRPFVLLYDLTSKHLCSLLTYLKHLSVVWSNNVKATSHVSLDNHILYPKVRSVSEHLTRKGQQGTKYTHVPKASVLQ